MKVNDIWLEPPSKPILSALWRYALTFDGYSYARDHLNTDCGDLANRRRQEYAKSGEWNGTFEELRCCLFFEQRRYRHFGEGPGGEDLDAI